MMKKYATLPILAILFFAGVSPAIATVLLLHGGNVIQGDASQAEGVYHVATDTGQIRISADRVERVFDTMEDVYNWKRTLIRIGNHSEHIELARWCLKYDLLDLAQRELVDAELAEPGTPMVDYLQRRLTAKRNVNVNTTTSEVPQPFTPLPTAKPIPKISPLVLNPEEEVQPEVLDGMVESISPGSLAQFSRTIQPILLNNCTTGGCHVGVGSEKMRLSRSGLAGRAGRRTTQRNPYAVLECIDLDRPDYSPLVTIPLRPHGKDAEVMVHGHREEYQSLVYWVLQVSRERNKTRTAGNPAPGGATLDGAVQPVMHTEPGKSIVRETLDMIPPEGTDLHLKGKDGQPEPNYPSDNVSSTSPFRKALAVNPGLLKAFIERAEDRGQRTENREEKTEDR